jgi:hypothetical protein
VQPAGAVAGTIATPSPRRARPTITSGSPASNATRAHAGCGQRAVERRLGHAGQSEIAPPGADAVEQGVGAVLDEGDLHRGVVGVEGGGRRDAGRPAVEQRLAELGLEPPDLRADAWLGDVRDGRVERVRATFDPRPLLGRATPASAARRAA